MELVVCPKCRGILFLKDNDHTITEYKIKSDGSLNWIDSNTLLSEGELSCENDCDLSDVDYEYNTVDNTFTLIPKE